MAKIESDFNSDNLFNPCKTCLKRPVCKFECKDFNEYKSVTDFIWFLGVAALIFIIYLIVIITSYTLNYKVLFYIAITILAFGYFSAIRDVLKDLDNFLELKVWERYLAFFLYPFGTVSYFIYNHTGLEDNCEKYMYRFNKPLYERLQR